MKPHVVAVDPGVGGGLAILTSETVRLEPMPSTLTEILELLRYYKNADAVCIIEDIPKFAGKFRNESTTAVLFQNYGRVEGIAVSLGYSVVRVQPRAWQAVLGLGKRGDRSHAEWKRALKNKAQELFPFLSPTLKTADALLMLHHYQGTK